jgi:hypothetical protein
VSTALTVDNRDQAVTQALAGYWTILAAARKSEEKGRDYPDSLHVAKLEVIVRGLELVADKYGVTL